MKTKFETTENALKNRKWFVVDAQDQIVGRIASKIAPILRGKNHTRFTPHADCGDFVVVINADKVKFSGTKFDSKIYYKHTGYVGSLKMEKAKHLLERKPEEILIKAVQKMLPKTPLGRSQLTKLKVYQGAEHPHSAQNPNVVSL